jgi:uncharacterized OB-fold protein
MAIVTKASRNLDLRVWEGEFPVRYLYTYGVAGERFFREIRESARIMGIRCRQCDVIHLPPTIYCDLCFSRLEQWVDVGKRGKVYSFTLSWLNRDGSRRNQPAIIGLIRFDGVRGGLIHRIGEVDANEIKIDISVEAVFKKAEERMGSILDIAYFRPVR